MKVRLKKIGWVCLALTVALGLPVLLIQLQAMPRLDRRAVLRLCEREQAEFLRANAALNPQPMDPALNKPLEHPKENPHYTLRRGNRLAQLAQEVVRTPALAPERRELFKLVESRLALWDAATSRSVVFYWQINFKPLLALGDSEPIDHSRIDLELNWFVFENIVKARQLQAAEAFDAGRWSDALRLLDSVGRFCDSIRFLNFYCASLSANDRYPGYDMLVRDEVPPAVEAEVLRKVTAMRASDPDQNRWMLFNDWRTVALILMNANAQFVPSPPGFIERNIGINITRAWWMIDAIATKKDRIRDPGLKARAEYYAGLHDAAKKNPGAAMESMLKWTGVPAARKFIAQMLRREPWVYQNPLLPAEALRTLDPWTLLMLNGPSEAYPWFNPAESNEIFRSAATRGRLLEAALAARLWRERTGQWPASIEAMAPLWRPPATDGFTTTTEHPYPAAPYLPLRIGEREVNAGLRLALWKKILPLYLAPQVTTMTLALMMELTTKPGGEFEFIIRDDRRTEPIVLTAIEQALRAHPKLVESVAAEMIPWGAKNEAWRPLDPAYARRVTDYFDATTATVSLLEQNAYADAIDETYGISNPAQKIDLKTRATLQAELDARMAQLADPPPAALRLRGKLRAPDKMIVIWSPGPDGKDDGGLMIYDREHEPTSGGDMVEFPEGY